MKVPLTHHFYRLLWRSLPKKMIVIEGVEITYVLLPSWFCKEATAFTRRSTKSQMIFLPRSEKFRALTVYHEYIESCAMLDIGLFADMAKARIAIEEACEEIQDEIPNIQANLLRYVEQTKDYEHAFALVLELSLAKRRLPTSVYTAYCQDAMKNRLCQPPQ